MSEEKAPKIDLDKVDISGLEIIDKNQLGPLPDNSLKYLAALGATTVEITVKDGRSWIVTGINVFRGVKRVFIARVFVNGYVRGYLAPPLPAIDSIVNSLRMFADRVVKENDGSI